MSKYKSSYTKLAVNRKNKYASNCGAGKEGSSGFQPGNTCAGDGKGGGAEDPKKKKPKKSETGAGEGGGVDQSTIAKAWQAHEGANRFADQVKNLPSLVDAVDGMPREQQEELGKIVAETIERIDDGWEVDQGDYDALINALDNQDWWTGEIEVTGSGEGGVDTPRLDKLNPTDRQMAEAEIKDLGWQSGFDSKAELQEYLNDMSEVGLLHGPDTSSGEGVSSNITDAIWEGIGIDTGAGEGWNEDEPKKSDTGAGEGGGMRNVLQHEEGKVGWFGNYAELNIPQEAVDDIAQQGSNDEAVDSWHGDIDFSNITDENLKNELEQHDLSENQMSSRENMEKALLWMSAHDISEDPDMYAPTEESLQALTQDEKNELTGAGEGGAPADEVADMVSSIRDAGGRNLGDIEGDKFASKQELRDELEAMYHHDAMDEGVRSEDAITDAHVDAVWDSLGSVYVTEEERVGTSGGYDEEAGADAPSKEDIEAMEGLDIMQPDTGSGEGDGEGGVPDSPTSEGGKPYGTDSEMRVWIGDLGAYNAGELKGEWVNASDVQEAWKHLRENEGYGEEYYIGDVEGVPRDLAGQYGYGDLDEIANYANTMESHDNPEAFQAYVDATGLNMEDAVEQFEDRYAGEAGDMGRRGSYDLPMGFVYDLIDDTGGVEEIMKNNPGSYVDREKLVRDLSYDNRYDIQEDDEGSKVVDEDGEVVYHGSDFNDAEGWIQQSDEELADELIEGGGLSNPDSYFDYEQYAFDLVVGGDIMVSDGYVFWNM